PHPCVHSHFLERRNFSLSLNSSSRNDRMFRRRPQRSKPFQIRAGHRPFAIHIRAKKRRTVRRQRRHDLLRRTRQRFLPPLHRNFPAPRVQRNHHTPP